MFMVCPSCHGKGGHHVGNQYYEDIETCSLCEGWGKVEHIKNERSKCSNCGGSGKQDESYVIGKTGIHEKYGTRKVKCYSCSGSGTITTSYYKPIPGHGSSCFITTSALTSLGITNDDCVELETFRKFRDNWLKTNYPESIHEYYFIAPKIVANIMLRGDSDEIWQNIWHNYLSDCLNYICKGENEIAYSLYRNLVLELSQKYLDNVPL